MKHELKTINPYFEDVWDRRKSFEVRLNDRGFKQGDHILMREYDPRLDVYSTRSILVEITYILSGYPALKDGYVVFGFKVLNAYNK